LTPAQTLTMEINVLGYLREIESGFATTIDA
jgi:hypothetical protein